MSPNRKALVFDVGPECMGSVEDALPGWEIDVLYGATVSSLPSDWDPGAVDLLIVGPRENVAETLGLCRFLSYCTPFSRDFHENGIGALGLRGSDNLRRRPDALLIVLVPPERADVVPAALRAGADHCLMLPITAQDVAGVLPSARGACLARRALHLA